MTNNKKKLLSLVIRTNKGPWGIDIHFIYFQHLNLCDILTLVNWNAWHTMHR